MGAKKQGAQARGAELIKSTIEVARATDITHPRPVPSAVLKRLSLPGGEPLSPGMRELLAFDASWIGMQYDDEDAAFEALSLEELVEQEFDKETVPRFAEAYGILDEECILIDNGSDSTQFLYVGTCDDAGEYPVITVSDDDGPWVGGFVPFDIWVAQQLGAIPKEKTPAGVPVEYTNLVKDLASKNGDGRASFVPTMTP
jgi:hypothetical protein